MELGDRHPIVVEGSESQQVLHLLLLVGQQPARQRLEIPDGVEVELESPTVVEGQVGTQEGNHLLPDQVVDRQTTLVEKDVQGTIGHSDHPLVGCPGVVLAGSPAGVIR